MKKKYYIVSLKNTKAKDASLTLWRPDNAGYTYFLCAAGVYDEIENTRENRDLIRKMWREELKEIKKKKKR